MKIDAARDGGSAVLRLGGRLDREWAEHLSNTLEDLLREGVRSLSLDLSEVTYISSAATRRHRALAAGARDAAGRGAPHLALPRGPRRAGRARVGRAHRRDAAAPPPRAWASPPGRRAPAPLPPTASTRCPPPARRRPCVAGCTVTRASCPRWPPAPTIVRSWTSPPTPSDSGSARSVATMRSAGSAWASSSPSPGAWPTSPATAPAWPTTSWVTGPPLRGPSWPRGSPARADSASWCASTLSRRRARFRSPSSWRCASRPPEERPRDWSSRRRRRACAAPGCSARRPRSRSRSRCPASATGSRSRPSAPTR